MKTTILIAAFNLLSFLSHAQVSNGLKTTYSFSKANGHDEQGTHNGIVQGVTLTTDQNPVTAAEVLVQPDITVSPNPANDKVNFSQACNVSVSDILGNHIMHKLNTSTIDIKSLEQGIYFIQISSLKRELLQKVKLIVE